ncbi:MAG: SDR family NAD(P)-dependent oxidoreductase [Sideroxyarcus sp.]|nr:SDR family NAD(P)-dependent oxidoreductase [Sideroxyarcus sp.]
MNPKIKDWRGQRVWVIGASSGIGAETARLLLEQGAWVALSARSRNALQEIASDDANAMILPLDITHAQELVAARVRIMEHWGGIDLVLVVAGTYNKMRADDFDLAVAAKIVDTNIRGTLNCLNAVLPSLIAQGQGGIGIVASVAGLSGLPQALVYGPTKAALINLCESLYLDLRPRGIGVYLINPGFVATPLTASNDFKMPALISATTAAHELVRGIERGEFHIHFPKRFTNWLRLLRLLPYRWYFRIVHKVTGL